MIRMCLRFIAAVFVLILTITMAFTLLAPDKDMTYRENFDEWLADLKDSCRQIRNPRKRYL